MNRPWPYGTVVSFRSRPQLAMIVYDPGNGPIQMMLLGEALQVFEQGTNGYYQGVFRWSVGHANKTWTPVDDEAEDA